MECQGPDKNRTALAFVVAARNSDFFEPSFVSSFSCFLFFLFLFCFDFLTWLYGLVLGFRASGLGGNLGLVPGIFRGRYEERLIRIMILIS